MSRDSFLATLIAVYFALFAIVPLNGQAHCDSIHGPVVADARRAIEEKDVNPVLKWVNREDEETVRSAFTSVLSVRELNSEAQQLADLYFFETVVRLHRASEGAPFTGLKEVDSHESPVVELADISLESGSSEEILHFLIETVRQGIQDRFITAGETKTKANHSIEEGRNFVAAYVEYVHYAHNIYEAASGLSSAHGAQVSQDHQGSHAAEPSHLTHAKLSPQEILEQEHTLTLEVVKAADQTAQQILETGKVDQEQVQKIIDFFTNFVDRCHHAKEERFYFPYASKYDSTHRKHMVDLFTQEHEQGRELLHSLSNLIKKSDLERAEIQKIHQDLKAYNQMIREHIHKENHELLSINQLIFPEEVAQHILQGFNRIEHEELGEGFHETYHNMALEIVQE